MLCVVLSWSPRAKVMVWEVQDLTPKTNDFNREALQCFNPDGASFLEIEEGRFTYGLLYKNTIQKINVGKL